MKLHTHKAEMDKVLYKTTIALVCVVEKSVFSPLSVTQPLFDVLKNVVNKWGKQEKIDNRIVARGGSEMKRSQYFFVVFTC